MTAHTAACPAKINLALSVGPPADNGMHPISSWMVRVSLADTLDVQRLDPTEPSTFDIDWAEDAPQPSAIDWPIESDFACLACQWVEQSLGQPMPVAVRLRKRIPVGAGMAGGSSNAASMITALDTLFELGLDAERRALIGSRIGSDVPFFFGPNSAIVGGFGDTIETAPLANPIRLCLITPPLGCNTGAVYGAFDRLRPDAALDAERVWALSGGPPDSDALFNDLAEAACTVEPRLAQTRQACADACGRPVHVTGSGAGLFVICDSIDDATACADQVTGTTGVPAVAAQTI